MAGTWWRRSLKLSLGGLLVLVVLHAALDLLDLPTRVGSTAWGRAARAWALAKLGAPEPRQAERPARVSSVSPYLPSAVSRTDPLAPVRLLDGEIAAEGEGRFERLRVYLDAQWRAAVAGLVPFAFRVPLQVPSRGELWLGLNHEGAGLDGADVVFRLRVIDRGRDAILLEDKRRSFGTGWQERKLDLDRWAGRRVELVFETSVSGNAAGDEQVRGFWADLVVRSRRPRPQRPNVAIVLMDTLRPDHLGAYGYARDTSPHIDAIAGDGVVFDRATSTAPWTDPSILTLLTGLYPSDVWEAAHRVEVSKHAVPDGVDTLAELLQRAGYFTIAASDHPGIHGGRFGQGFDVFTMLYDPGAPGFDWRGTGAREVLRQVEDQLRGRGGGGLFLYLHLIYPHAPYRPPPEYDGLFGPGEYRIDPSNRAGLINLYDAEIRRTDATVGALRRLLEEHGLADDLVLVLVSDHGEGFWEHDLWEHGNSLYNELLRVPLILHAPGRLPAGVRVDATTGLVDVLPTLAELVGLEVPPAARGRSLLPVIQGRAGDARLAYSEFPHTRDLYAAYGMQSDAYKIIFGQDHAKEPRRFDLARDALELHPLAAPDPALDAPLRQEMERIRAAAELHRSGLATAIVEPSEDTVKKLRSLGYVD